MRIGPLRPFGGFSTPHMIMLLIRILSIADFHDLTYRTGVIVHGVISNAKTNQELANCRVLWRKWANTDGAVF